MTPPRMTTDDNQLYVRMGWLSYMLSWCCLHSLHMLCGAYFVVAGLVYWSIPATRLVWHLQLYNMTLSYTHFRKIAVVHYVLAGCHFGAILAFFLRVLYRRGTAPATRQKHEGAVEGDVASAIPHRSACCSWLQAVSNTQSKAKPGSTATG
ncbi:hypothetical protein PINS_up020681 [Pythium insidiosum]|nr:hypothetical protein PINS_up020681 [Pythium insidiosum]